MSRRTQISALAAAAALSLAIGIPVLAFTVTPGSERIGGTVLSVVPAQNAILIHALTGPRKLRRRDVVIRTSSGQQVRTAHGSEDLDRLLPGQHVSARVKPGSRHALDLTETD